MTLQIVRDWVAAQCRLQVRRSCAAAAQAFARAMLSSRSRLTAAEAVIVAAVEAAVPRLATAR